MSEASHVRDLIRKAIAKQASSINTERNDEHAADVKAAIPASVDSQTAADATGSMAKDPAVTMAKAEASTDVEMHGMIKDKDDNDAFKSASALRKQAVTLINAITKAAETALTVDAPQSAGTQTQTVDQVGKEEKIGDAKSDGAAAQTDKSLVQTSATKVEASAKSAGVLAMDLYKLAQTLLEVDDFSGFCKAAAVNEEEANGELAEGDIEGLEDPEADEVAAALEASAMDAAGEGTEDAEIGRASCRERV